MADFMEATPTLTHVSMMGTTATDGAEVFTWVMLPDSAVSGDDDADTLAHCEIETSSAHTAQVQLALYQGDRTFSLERLTEEAVRFGFNTDMSVQSCLDWTRRVFPEAKCTNPRYWLSLQSGSNTVPTFYIDDVGGTGKELVLRQHLTAEEGQPEVERFSKPTWQRFTRRLIDSGLFCEVSLQEQDGGEYRLHLQPTSDVTHVIERLVITIAGLFPLSQPRTRRRHDNRN